LSGSSLTVNAIGAASRATPAAIEAYLLTLMP
jgi:hypothetical protein